MRSGDSISSETIGQDYLTFRYEQTNLVFAVCDGVGQSFMGDLAARLLGNGLCDWLWGISCPTSADSFSQEVAEALNTLTSTSAPQVTAFKLPEALPPLLVQALEMQRQYGSESMFVAGRLALAGAESWIALCWLGDSPVAAIDIDGKLVDLGPRGHTSERWNATTGVKGTVHTWVGKAENVARVAGYTDGLAVSHVPTDADLAHLMAEWETNPPADDASLFDVRLAPSPQTTGESDESGLLAGDEGEADRLRKLGTTPIVVEDEERTPLTALQPIDLAPPAERQLAVESWRPLSEEQTAPPAPGQTPVSGDVVSSLGLDRQQQLQMWQQAALLGLTSAALAMLMLERLISEEWPEEGSDTGEAKRSGK